MYSLHTALSNFSRSENTDNEGGEEEEEEVQTPSVTTSESRDSVVYISEAPILQQILRSRRPSQPKKKKRCTSMRVLVVILVLTVITGIVFLCLYFTGVLPFDRYPPAYHDDNGDDRTVTATVTTNFISSYVTSTAIRTISPTMIWLPTPTYTAAFAPLPVRVSSSAAPLMKMGVKSAGVRVRGSLAMVVTVMLMGSWGLVQIVGWTLMGLICTIVDKAVGWGS